MIISKEKVLEAKEKFGEKAIEIIKNELKLKNFDELHSKSLCPFHKEDSGSFIWNPKNFSFKCFGCGNNYDILDHWMSFDGLTYIQACEKLFRETEVPFSFAEKGLKEKDTVYPKGRIEFPENFEKVVGYWQSRGISEDTLKALDVTADAKGNTVFHYYDDDDVLTFVKYRPSRKVEKGEDKFWAENGCTKKTLFNMNRINIHKPLVIQEGEGDCLAVYESGYTNVVSVPIGANNYGWIELCWDWLDQFDKIIVWSDNDDAGIKMRKEVCSRLGTWRTYYVNVPNKMVKADGTEVAVKDANEVLFHFGKEKVLDFINNANELPITGVVDLASVDDFDIEKADGLYTNVKAIDDIVYKFLMGSVVLLTGLKGSGKSVMINQNFVCEALNQGKDVFMFSGELSSPVLKSWFELTMAGPEKVKMKNDFVHIIDKTARQEMRSWYGNRVWVYDDISNDAADILEKAITLTRKNGVKVWILDNLMTISLGENENNSLMKQKEFIVKLVNLAKLYNVLIILVGHPRKIMPGMTITSDDISGSSNLGNMVQYILSVHRFTDAEKKGERDNKGNFKKGKEPIDEDVEVTVLKNRYTGKLGKARLFFHYASYRFFGTPKELWKRYGWNRDSSPLPTNNPNLEDSVPEGMR